MTFAINELPASELARLRELILQRSTIDEASGCWLWGGNVHASTGYGRVSIGRRADETWRAEYAHRIAHVAFIGPIPAGLTVDHVRDRGCLHKRCVNPAHLQAVTRVENTLRGDSIHARNARKTVCDQGHQLAGANLDLYRRRDGRLMRRCRACARAYESRRVRRKAKTTPTSNGVLA